MKEWKTAIVGCGLISKNHLKAINNLETVTCIAVCDIEKEKAEAAAKMYGVKQIYTDYQEMLRNPEIDVVHICTPHYLHAQMAIDALHCGKNVLCEKPMALTVEDAKKMAAAEKDSGKLLGICFQNRYNEAVSAMRKILQSGTLGKLLGARGQVTWNRNPEYYSSSPWKGRWATEGGGVLINQAIHTLDLLQWLTCPVVSVEAGIATRRLKDVIEVEDTADVLMIGEHGERLLFYATNCYVKNAPVELEIVCENGSVKMTGNTVSVEKKGKMTVTDYSSGTTLGKDYWGSGHGVLIQDFYHCIQEKIPFSVGSAEAIVSVQLLHAIYCSAREGKMVYL